MDEEILEECEKLFLSLSDKTRLRILSIIDRGETSVGFLAESLRQSQPKISRHLAYLRNTGLVSTRRDGKRIYYGIEPDMHPSTLYLLSESLRTIQDKRGWPYQRAESSIPYTECVVALETPEEMDREEPVRDEIEIFLL